MSYEIVRKLRIENGIVYRTSASNNVRPQYFEECQDTYFTEMLRNEGETALDMEILKLYETGSFQEGNSNKWSKAIDKLRQTKEYALIDWRKSKYTDECSIYKARYQNEELYNKILSKALQFLPSHSLQLF